jgi:hypothetical protein
MIGTRRTDDRAVNFEPFLGANIHAQGADGKQLRS